MTHANGCLFIPVERRLRERLTFRLEDGAQSFVESVSRDDWQLAPWQLCLCSFDGDRFDTVA